MIKKKISCLYLHPLISKRRRRKKDFQRLHINTLDTRLLRTFVSILQTVVSLLTKISSYLQSITGTQVPFNGGKTHTHTDGGRCLCEMILMYICRWKEKYVQGRTEVFRTKAKKSFRLPCQYRVIRKCNVREKFVFFLFSSFSSSYYFNSCPMILIEHLRNPFYVDIISLKNNV